MPELIAYDPFVAVFGSVPPGDEEMLIKVVANAVRSGFAIVLDRPGTKIPMCTLNTRDRKHADTEAKEAARLIGDERWDRRRHPCGLNHAITLESLGGDPKTVLTKVGAIIRRVTKEHGGTPNIGVEVGRSRLLVVDVDTAAELHGFRTWWQARTDIPVPGLTVQSPGVQDVDGGWVHKDGGHIWMTVPAGVTLPAGTGTYRAPSGWVAMWSGHQVLVPPSSRPEGDYLLVGQLNEAPGFMTDELAAASHARMERATARSGPLPDGTGDIDRWAAGLPWADLLEQDDWTDTGLPDGCSCPIWTAPGGHASPKSATAHDVGCDHFDVAVGHAPLHVWTDNPPDFLDAAYRATGSRTFTKLQYVAWRDHEGDAAGALKALGMGPQEASIMGSTVPADWATPASTFDQPPAQDPFSQASTATEDQDDADPSPAGQEPGESRAEAGEDPDVEPDSWAPIPLDGRQDEDHETPPTVMPRSDGAICLLYPGLIHSIHGESESGKSWVIQAEVVRLALAGEQVLFLDFENDWRAVLRRFKALGATETALKNIDYRNPDSSPNFGSENWVGMFTTRYTLVVIDGVTDALGIFGQKTKDNDDVSLFLRKVPRALARKTGAAVVMIDHVTKSAADRGRFAIGGQAKMAGLDGAAYYVDVLEPLGRGKLGKLLLKVGKDKPGYVRGVAQGFDVNRMSDIALFTLDATGPTISAELGPLPDPFATAYFDPDAANRVLGLIADSDGMSQRSVEAIAGMKAERVREMLTGMAGKGWLEITHGPRNSKVYRVTEVGGTHLESLEPTVEEPEE